MLRINYRCTLLTDLILKSSTATEGVHPSLDYIPGAKFLGVVAGRIFKDLDDDQRLALFFSGAVRFGDAHLIANDAVTYSTPFNYLHEKEKEKTGPFYLSDQISAEQLAAGNFKVAKQFYLQQGKDDPTTINTFRIGQHFSLKSARDRKTRRAEDGKLFGYSSLPEGLQFQFSIDYDDPAHRKTVENALLGERPVGRSKSAQYGMILIAPESETKPKAEIVTVGTHYLYAKSNCCFYDVNGVNTTQPDADQLGLPAGSTIDWQKSQLRTRRYATYNGTRQARNTDRTIIEKGSVFLIETTKEATTAELLKGVGSHRGEGFGQLFLDPFFLKAEKGKVSFNFQRSKLSFVTTGPAIGQSLESQEKTVLSFVRNSAKTEQKQIGILKDVNGFIEDHKASLRLTDISPSQWGQLRRIAKACYRKSDLLVQLFDPQNGFCTSGVSQNVWSKYNRGTQLQSKLNDYGNDKSAMQFLAKLATELPKLKGLQKTT